MEPKRYIQVFIKSEADLPKELKDKNITDWYFIGTDILEMVGYYDFDMGAWYGQDDEQLHNPDWYLLPEPSNVPKSAEEIANKHYSDHLAKAKPFNDITWVYNAIKDYASQHVNILSDEKIQSLAEELYPDSLGKQVTFCEQIIWFINKLK